MARFAIALAAALILGSSLAAAQNPAATVSIDAAKNQHPISPLVYGVSEGAASDLVVLNAPVNRSGGDLSSTYNWKANTINLSNDWYFESLDANVSAGDPPSAVPAAADDLFISATQAGAGEPMMTVPMLGWVARLGPNRSKLVSFSIKKYGPECKYYQGQSGFDPYYPDAGKGIERNCQTYVTGNDPHDAYIQDSIAAEQGLVQHLVAKWHGAAAGGVPYYIMDNESSIWFGTHRDVHPIGPHATEISNDVINTSKMVKSVDPHAQVVAPEEYGWFGYLYSGFDQQYLALNGFGAAAPDRTNVMGGMDYIPWLLQQWKAAGHPIDVLSVHFYPDGGEYGTDDSTGTQLLRNQSTRLLWDPNYIPPEYPNVAVAMIPLLQSWVQTYYYPGTPVAITEYNWGDEGNINGATTQADIDGIFGAYGLNLATRWTVPAHTTPTFKAMQMYRNYDGHDSAFGDTSISTTTTSSNGANTPDHLTAYAATRSLDGAMTVVVINKDLSGTTAVTLDLANFSSAGTVQQYQLTSTNAIIGPTALTLSGSSLALTAPPQSVTLLVLPAAGKPLASPPTASLQATPATTYAPLPPNAFSYSVSFVGKGKTQAGGTIESYLWDFGDGTNATGAKPAHAYTRYGIFTVTLTVKDSLGLAGTATQTVAVEPQPQPGVTCTAAYNVTNVYGSGTGGTFLANVLITNTSQKGIGDWVVTWNWPAQETIVNLWNAASYAQTGTTVSAVSYGGSSVGPGQTANPSFYADTNGADPTNPAPTNFMINGTSCTAG